MGWIVEHVNSAKWLKVKSEKKKKRKFNDGETGKKRKKDWLQERPLVVHIHEWLELILYDMSCVCVCIHKLH